MIDYAEIAYEAYAKAVGGKTWDDRPMPTWEELQGTKQAEGWDAAAQAVLGSS